MTFSYADAENDNTPYREFRPAGTVVRRNFQGNHVDKGNRHRGIASHFRYNVHPEDRTESADCRSF